MIEFRMSNIPVADFDATRMATEEHQPAKVPHQPVVPNETPTAVEWKTLQPIIRRLYLEENRPLKDVAEVMRERFSFNATSVWSISHILIS